MLLEPRLRELYDKADSRYTLVIMAAKRAREIIDQRNEFEKNIEDFAGRDFLNRDGKYRKPLSEAISEIAREDITYNRDSE